MWLEKALSRSNWSHHQRTYGGVATAPYGYLFPFLPIPAPFYSTKAKYN